MKRVASFVAVAVAGMGTGAVLTVAGGAAAASTSTLHVQELATYDTYVPVQPLIGEFVHRLQLVHRLGTMEDIVSAMLFLCSDEASFITGETLKVSGGYPLNF